MANVVTEEVAKTKWCPHVRLAAPVDSEASGTSGNRYGEETVKGSACIASKCMAWRWRIGMWNTKENRWWKEGDKATMSDVEERFSDYGSCGLAGAA